MVDTVAVGVVVSREKRVWYRSWRSASASESSSATEHRMSLRKRRLKGIEIRDMRSLISKYQQVATEVGWELWVG